MTVSRAEVSAAPAPPLRVWALLLGLVLLAGTIRLVGLRGPDGVLDKDEARLALAASGVLERGVPMLPSGRVYTRGIVNSYALAPAFALLDRSDFAARLPSAIAGTLLVVAVFLLGRAVNGAPTGLAAAAFVALADPLVAWSRSAWLPSLFLLLLVLTVYGWYRGFVEQRAGWQLAGSACFVLALLSYEFAILLVGGLVLYLGLRLLRRDRSWYLGPTTLMALALVAAGLAAFGGLLMALRAGTLAGSLGEARQYFTPGLALSGLAFYLQSLFSEYTPLMVAALAGLPLLARKQPRGTLYLTAFVLVIVGVPSFLIHHKYSIRYVLPALPLLAVLAAAGVVSLVALVGSRLRIPARIGRALAGLSLVALFGLALYDDLGAAARRLQASSTAPTWLDSVPRSGPRFDDLVITEGPEVAQFYLGRADFNFYTGDYRRYTYRAPDAVRSIYTGSALLHTRGDFERLVERTNRGRTAWVIGHEERLRRLVQEIDPDLWPSLLRSADSVTRTSDGWVLLRLTLPRRGSGR